MKLTGILNGKCEHIHIFEVLKVYVCACVRVCVCVLGVSWRRSKLFNRIMEKCSSCEVDLCLRKQRKSITTEVCN